MDKAAKRLAAMQWVYGDGDKKALTELERRIAAVGRTVNDFVNYSQLVSGVTFKLPNVNGGKSFEICEWTNLDRAIIGNFLGRISADSYQEGRFLSSALVIGVDSNGPGEGFFSLAEEAGLLTSKDETMRLTFWIENIRQARGTHLIDRLLSWISVCDREVLMAPSVEGKIRDTGHSYPDGLKSLEIHVAKNKAVGVPYVLDQPTPVRLQILDVIYDAELRATSGNGYVWISPTLKSSSGKRTTLSAVLDQGGFLANEKVSLQVDGTRIVVSKFDNASRYLVGADWLLRIAADAIDDIESASHDLEAANPTTRTALIEARIGQGKFRDDLLFYWGGCALTGCSVSTALTASHIKPWRDSSNQERVDPYNGLLLLGTFDLLFDDGLITFDDTGRLIVSNYLPLHERQALALNQEPRLRRIESQHIAYLAWHRQHVFRKHC